MGPLFHPPAVPIPSEARATRELLKYVPQMSMKERDYRWDRARKRMLMAGLDALLFMGNDIFWGAGMANLRYMFQVDSHSGAQALFPLNGDPVVWNGIPHNLRPTHMYLSLQEWVKDFRVVGGVPSIVAEINERGLDRSKIGVVSFSSTIQTTPTLLHQDAVMLEKLLPNVQFFDANWLTQEMRMVKSEEEIGKLRQAAKIARKVVDAMINTARPGRTEAEVYAEMIRTQIANGGDPNVFNFLSSGPVEHPKNELWHLLHGCEQPLSPTTRPLAEGDIIISEFHTKYAGYRCHTEYSVYLGKKAPPKLLNIWNVGIECLEASKEALVAGRTIREAVDMVRKPAERAGLDWVELGFHAMGCASPEFPTVVYREGFGYDSMNGHGIGDLVLEEGMCFGNNIDLHDSRWKPDVGTKVSDFMVVRDKRAECLVDTPTELAQVG